MSGVGGEEEGVGDVDAGEEDEAAPAEHEPRPVVHDVDRAANRTASKGDFPTSSPLSPVVATLPDEELGDVDELEGGVDGEGAGDAAGELRLLPAAGDDEEGPEEHPQAAVRHLLHVPPSTRSFLADGQRVGEERPDPESGDRAPSPRRSRRWGSRWRPRPCCSARRGP